MARVAAVWDETRASAQPAVWITHGGVIRAALLLAQGVRQVQQAHQWPSEMHGFGEWRVLTQIPPSSSSSSPSSF